MALSVLTGDFIDSAAWPSETLERAHQALARTAQRIAPWSGGDTLYSRHRGDGWQIVLHDPRRDLRAALILRACLRGLGKGLATRIAMARGPGALGAGDLNAAHGPVFTASGRGLDALHDGPATMSHADGGALGAATRLADQLSGDWTPAQARAIGPLLAPSPPTHADLADTLGISRPAISQAARAAGLDAFETALTLIEEPPA